MMGDGIMVGCQLAIAIYLVIDVIVIGMWMRY